METNTRPDPVKLVVKRLKAHKSGDGWTARCPAHDDQHESLTIGQGQGGRILLHCHAGCPFEKVAAALKLTPTDLAPAVKVADKSRELKDAALVDRVYSCLLDNLKLSLEHFEALQKRGLPDDWIKSRGYRTMPKDKDRLQALAAVHSKFTADELSEVPGFIKGGGLNARPGLVIPVRSADGSIVGLQIRADDDKDGPRYSWVSSKDSKTAGPLHFVGLEATADKNTDYRPGRVILTEGPLKADVIYCVYGEPVVAVPGVAKWQRLLGAVEALRPRRVSVAFDSDWQTNANVWRATRDLTAALVVDGHAVDLLTWDRKWKGFDDLIVAGHWPTVADNPLAELATKAPISPPDSSAPVVVVRSFEDIEPAKVDWLWPGYLPLGTVDLIEGNPSLAKTTLVLDVAARLTRGVAMPDGSQSQGVSSVLVMSAEDDPARVLAPRLMAAGADMRKVHSVMWVREGTSVRLPRFPDDGPIFEQALATYRPRLVIIDPYFAYVGSGTDTHNDASVRRGMSCLSMYAVQYQVVIILIRHWVKKKDLDAMARGGGSIGIIASVRSAFACGYDPHAKDPLMAAICPVKMNLGPIPGGLNYKAVSHPFTSGTLAGTSVPKIEWCGPTETRARELEGEPRVPVPMRDQVRKHCDEFYSGHKKVRGELELEFEAAGLDISEFDKHAKRWGVNEREEEDGTVIYDFPTSLRGK